jgi:hypothetical protein
MLELCLSYACEETTHAGDQRRALPDPMFVGLALYPGQLPPPWRL